MHLYPQELANGQFLRKIKFKFPVFYDGQDVREICWDKDSSVETVVLLSQQKPDDAIEVEIELDELDLTSAESKATYKEIQEYVLKAQEVRWTSVLRGPKRSEDRR